MIRLVIKAVISGAIVATVPRLRNVIPASAV
jgi:hypothetical protein